MTIPPILPRPPRRSSGAFVALHRRITAWLLLVLGFAAAVMGLGIMAVEIWHAITNRHPAIWSTVGLGVGLFTFGAGLIQTGSVQNSLSVLREFLGEVIPLLASRKVNGMRSTDIKIPAQRVDDDTDDGDASDSNRRP